ncbi:MAG: Flp pilus assembly complex ATPase component TadA [Polyangiaceae bacterium]|nr:Flp pilus assembly complex ATPase component TadA [Polyangiaceae bacterium]
MTTPYASEAFLHQLLTKALAAKASDIHLKVGQPPGARVHGSMVYFRVDKIRPDDMEAAALILLGERPARDKIGTFHEVSFAYEAAGIGRFRASVYRQRGSLAAVLRSVPVAVPSFAELGLPPAAQALAEHARGLVLVAGGASSGRTTTVAAMIGHINETASKHILTLEDPIEYIHEDGRCSISQREVGRDIQSLHAGLMTVFRQDPDVVMIGELRDERALDLALDVAEMDRLVIATVPGTSVEHALRKLMTTPERRERIAGALQGALAQRLLPKQDAGGLALAAEVLIVTSQVRESIRRPDTSPPLSELMEKGATTYGMQTFDMHIRALAAKGLLSKELLATL